MMERQLINADFTVKSFEKTHLALDAIIDWTPKVALVDLDLEMDGGYELIKALLNKLPDIKIISYSGGDRESVWPKAKENGALYFFNKPVPKDALGEVLSQIFHDSGDALSKSSNILESSSTQPYETHIKCCYICGYERVKFFMPKANSNYENWDAGVYPIYQPLGTFDTWDFYKTMVAVCPKCLFASTDIRDFGEPETVKAFPYKPDAKKLIAIGMSTRRKMAGVNPEASETTIFDSPFRSKDVVLKSLQLAAKCGNGLILGDKVGAHAEIGLQTLLIAGIEENVNHETVRYAQSMFYDQLKIKRTPREIAVKCFYFIIATSFGIGESIKANEMKERLEKYYMDVPPEEAGENERLWNSRLLKIWQDGVDQTFRRKSPN